MTYIAYISIGSNLDAPENNCRRAIKLIENHPDIEVLNCSSFYKTEPWGELDQNWFINAAIKISTTLLPEKLLDALLGIENDMGRIRKKKWGPRVIDLDVLIYENKIIKKERLTVPHPAMTQRRFVLVPLAEISPDLVVPGQDRTIEALLEIVKDAQKVTRI